MVVLHVCLVATVRAPREVLMGSIMSTGYYREEAKRIQETKCRKSEDGKHKFKEYGSWPSSWAKCDNCGATYYDK